MTLRSTLLLLCLCVAPAFAEETPLFNGKDLSGWKVPKENIWWLVKDGVLQVRSGPDQKGSILWTEKEFEDFTVSFDFKFVSGTIDSGVHLRNSDQIQIGISGSLKRDMTASPYIPKKGYPVEAEGVAELLKMEDWNSMTITAKGMDYTVSLNGKEVMNYTSDTGLEKGPIGIQLHAKRDMGIDYRNIRVVEIE
ncbi:MAG: DUF1080 domain-containing protein [Verrucomicrobiota bacterium]